MANSESGPTHYPRQKRRLLALLVNGLLVLLFSRLVTGEWLPSAAGRRLWLVSSLSLFFLTLFSAPWFRPPRNVLVNALSALLLLGALDLGSIHLLAPELNTFRWVSLAI